MAKKTDVMDYLEIPLLGNAVQDWTISLAIFATSLVIAHYAHRAIRQVVFKWALKAQTQLGEERVTRACALITWAIPIVGFVLASNRLVLDKALSVWIPIGVLISSQIVSLLILMNLLPPLMGMMSSRYIDRVAEERLDYHQEHKQSVAATEKETQQCLGILLILVPLLTVLSTIPGVPMAIWAVPALVVGFALWRCRRIVLKARREIAENLDAQSTQAGEEVFASEEAPGIYTTETVVGYFLDLFKHQLGVAEDTPSDYILAERAPSTNNYIYELRVHAGNKVKTRRMTIAPLGEEGGSRSRCFYVIYDDHLVIKIPPVYIEGLSHYLEALKKEAHIIDRLAMKECVVPRVSAILKRVQTFPDEAHLTPEQIEARYIKWLTASPEPQEYLKIGDTFAFFMDFSEYYFLQHIMEYLHDIEGETCKEILGHSEIIWDLATLEKNYGPESLPVFVAMGEVYTRYEKRMKRLLTEYDLSSSVVPYQIRDWFFTYLAVSEVADAEKVWDPAFTADLNELLNNVMATHVKPVEDYRNTARAVVSKKQSSRTRPPLAGLVTNLIGLLARLKQKGVALRDLKPDNLLVAGDPGKYPSFLWRSDAYQIGIIDVETAVILGQTIEEPQLGGTPHYATPSHFFGNEVLRYAFADLPKTLHLQDWHAMVGIIYRVITGGVLFDKTAQMVPGIVQRIRNCSGSPEALFRVFKKVNREYWSTATAEFAAKMRQRADTLRPVKVVVPKTAGAMLKACVQEEKNQTAGAIKECVMSQRILGSDKNRSYLLSCSHERVAHLLKTYSHGQAGHTLDPAQKTRLTALLRKLGGLKLRWEQRTALARLLDEDDPAVGAYELLELMHGAVLRHMHRQ